MIITAVILAVAGLLRRARAGGEPSEAGKRIARLWGSIRGRARGYAAPALAATLPVAVLGGTLALAC